MLPPRHNVTGVLRRSKRKKKRGIVPRMRDVTRTPAPTYSVAQVRSWIKVWASALQERNKERLPTGREGEQITFPYERSTPSITPPPPQTPFCHARLLALTMGGRKGRVTRIPRPASLRVAAGVRPADPQIVGPAAGARALGPARRPPLRSHLHRRPGPAGSARLASVPPSRPAGPVTEPLPATWLWPGPESPPTSPGTGRVPTRPWVPVDTAGWIRPALTDAGRTPRRLPPDAVRCRPGCC